MGVKPRAFTCVKFIHVNRYKSLVFIRYAFINELSSSWIRAGRWWFISNRNVNTFASSTFFFKLLYPFTRKTAPVIVFCLCFYKSLQPTSTAESKFLDEHFYFPFFINLRMFCCSLGYSTNFLVSMPFAIYIGVVLFTREPFFAGTSLIKVLWYERYEILWNVAWYFYLLNSPLQSDYWEWQY